LFATASNAFTVPVAGFIRETLLSSKFVIHRPP
jgi:hypothetical protein